MGRPKKETTTVAKKEVKKVEPEVEETKVEVVETPTEEVVIEQPINSPLVEEPKVESTSESTEIARLQAQIELLMKAQMGAVQTSTKTAKKMVKIVSLANGGLTLQGSRAIRIPKQFDSITVTESEARIIVSNMPESARNGLFYIADRQFVEDNDLEDAYSTILDDTQLKTLLTKNADDVVEIYKNATDRQKATINSMIIDGRFNGARIDANILQELGTISGIDFMGIEKIEEA